MPHYAVIFQCMQTCREGLFKGTVYPAHCRPAGDVHGERLAAAIVTIEAAAVDRAIQQIGFC